MLFITGVTTTAGGGVIVNVAVCVLVAYGRILKQPILDAPKLGFLNLHPSLLPKYRGPSPIQSAIFEGETETGVTIMRIGLEMDAGDILIQRAYPIADDDTAETLSHRLGDAGAEMMIEALDAIEAGRAVFTPQDPKRATYCTMIGKDDARIDWIWRQTLQRMPSADERDAARRWLAAARAAAGDTAPATLPWQGLCQALLASNEFAYVD